MNVYKILLTIALGMALILAIPLSVSADVSPTPTPDDSISQQIEKLLNDYQKALDTEIQNGETRIVDDPFGGKNQLLTEKAQIRMDALWAETLKQINDLSAPPVQEQEEIIKLIESLGESNVSYIDLAGVPYAPSAKIERYQSNTMFYLVDGVTKEIINVYLRDDRNYKTELLYSQDELEKQAKQFVFKFNGENVNLDTLKPVFSNKEGLTYFFRWEDPSTKLSDGTTPFIQVGLSAAGDFLNYVNSLPFALSNRTMVSGDAVTSFNSVYANGGNYWQFIVGSMNTVPNAGFCYVAGWCTPKNFFWAYTHNPNYTVAGRWYKMSPNPSVSVKAWIPGTHASTIEACYNTFYNGGVSLYMYCINQNAISDDWTPIDPISLYNVSKVELSNGVDTPQQQVAWDEIWLYAP